MEIKEKEKGRDICGIEFPAYNLCRGKTVVDEAQRIEILHKEKVVVYLKEEVLDVRHSSMWKALVLDPIAMSKAREQMKETKLGIGPERRFTVILLPVKGEKKTLFSITDGGGFDPIPTQAGEWTIDNWEFEGHKLYLHLRNNIYPDKSKIEVIKIEELKVQKEKKSIKLTAQEAKLRVKEVGSYLGYDHTYDPEFLKTRKDVCAVRHMTENGSTYGFDTIYLVWKDKKGKVHHEELTNSRSTKDYLSVGKIEEKGDDIIVEVGGSRYRRGRKDLGIT